MIEYRCRKADNGFMNTQINPSTLDAAAAAVKKQWPNAAPRCGIILGSGWGDAVAGFQGDEIPYAAIPGLGTTGVQGHAGRLKLGRINGMEIFIFQGRRHWYEGEGWTPVILPVSLLHAFAAEVGASWVPSRVSTTGGTAQEQDEARALSEAQAIGVLG